MQEQSIGQTVAQNQVFRNRKNFDPLKGIRWSCAGVIWLGPTRQQQPGNKKTQARPSRLRNLCMLVVLAKVRCRHEHCVISQFGATSQLGRFTLYPEPENCLRHDF